MMSRSLCQRLASLPGLTATAATASASCSRSMSGSLDGGSDRGMIPVTRQREWNRAIAQAEKLVGFPTEFHLQALMTDDVTSMTQHLRKLMTSDHPILRTIKRLIHHEGKTDTQVRGLIVLLLARATANKKMSEMEDYDAKTGVLKRQRSLAEVIEMIHSAQTIHKSVLNLPFSLPAGEASSSPDLKEDLEELEYGNKLAILGGDYLLASACTNLAALRNTYVSEMIAVSIAEFAQSEFIGTRDVQGRFIPDSPEHLTASSWVQRTKLSYASLMGKGCMSAGLIAGLTEQECQLMGRIGEGLSMSLQAYTEVEPYADSNSVMSFVSTGQTIDFASAPVLFHLRTDPGLLTHIRDCARNNVENIDSAKVYNAVRNGPGLAEAKTFCTKLSTECVKDIEKLPEGPAREALLKLTTHLKYQD